ncbi:hypothetical protein CMI47_18490 [Candidatus Pacearchaeota archaeon]|nr:hypothetical protein [Candidatus Pacearchaeota archaeon]
MSQTIRPAGPLDVSARGDIEGTGKYNVQHTPWGPRASDIADALESLNADYSEEYQALMVALNEIVDAVVSAAAPDDDADELPSSDYPDLEYSFRVQYEEAEEARLQERFGSESSTTELVDLGVSTLSEAVASTTMKIEYNFKKIKYLPFREEDISTFETDESSQGVSVTATKTISTTTMGGTTTTY